MEQNNTAVVRFVDSGFRNGKTVVAIVGVVIVLAGAYAVLAPKEYGSTMKILVQNSRGEELISADRNSPVATGIPEMDMMESQINSEVELLQSADLMEGLVRYRDSQLKHIAPPQPGTLRMAHELADVEHHLEVTPLRKTNLIQVNFTDKNPIFAQKSLRWLSTAFLDKQAQLRRPPGTYQFFDNQERQSEQALRNAEANLIAFEDANSVISVTQEKNQIVGDLNGTVEQIGAIRADLRQDQFQIGGFEHQLDEVGKRITTQQQTAPSVYSKGQIETLLVELTNKRTRLLTRYLPTDRLVQEVDRQIASTQKALRNAEKPQVVETISDNNPIRTSLESNLRQTRVRLAGEQARLAALQQQADGFTRRLNDLQSITVQDDALERKVQDLRLNTDTYAQKRDEANIEDELDRKRIIDVAVAQEPTISVQPVQPHRVKTMALGALVSCFLSCAFVLISEAMRETAMTPHELDAMVSCPVLATIPEYSEKRIESVLPLQLTYQSAIQFPRKSGEEVKA